MLDLKLNDVGMQAASQATSAATAAAAATATDAATAAATATSTANAAAAAAATATSTANAASTAAAAAAATAAATAAAVDNSIVWIDPSLVPVGTGTLASPFNSWDSVTFTENTEYRQKSGTTWAGSLQVTAPLVTIRTYGGEAKALINATGFNRGINVWGGKYSVHIDNFEVYGCDTGTSIKGIAFGSNPASMSNGSSLTNCIIRNIEHPTPTQDVNGLVVYGDNFVGTDNLIHNIGTDGIWLYGNKPVLRYNHIHTVATDTPTRGNFGDCIQFSTGGVSDYLVEHNTLDHTNYKSKQCFIDGGDGITTGGFFQNNKCSMNATGATTESKVVNILNIGAVVYNNEITGGDYGLWAKYVKALNNDIRQVLLRGIYIEGGGDSIIKDNTVAEGLLGCTAILVDTAISKCKILSNTCIDVDVGFICNKTSALLAGGGVTLEKNAVVRSKSGFNLAYLFSTPIPASNTNTIT